METREETYAAIRKALATLDDPFTRLLDPGRFKALQRGTAGSVTGVGLEVGFVNQGSADSDLVVSSRKPVNMLALAFTGQQQVALAVKDL